MTSEEVLTCAINIGEQLLVSGAEISRVEDTIRRICNAYGIRQSHIFSIASCIIVTLETKERKWITQTRRILSYGTDMWKLDRLNDLSRRICATQPSFAVIDQEYEKILKGPTYSPAVQCGIYAMTAGAFAIFFGGNLWDGFASLFVGALIRVTLYALSAIKLKAIFSNILCSLISGMACILVCYLGIGQHVEMIMIGNIMLLIPGVLMTNSFRDFISGDMISGLLHFSEQPGLFFLKYFLEGCYESGCSFSHRIVFRVARICDHLQHPRAQSLDPGDRRGSFLGSVSCIFTFCE